MTKTNSNPVTPGTVTVTLPEGMSPEQFNKLFKASLKTQAYTKKYDKAVRDALSDLKTSHKEDYVKYLATRMRGQGLTPKAGK